MKLDSRTSHFLLQRGGRATWARIAATPSWRRPPPDIRVGSECRHPAMSSLRAAPASGAHRSAPLSPCRRPTSASADSCRASLLARPAVRVHHKPGARTSRTTRGPPRRRPSRFWLGRGPATGAPRSSIPPATTAWRCVDVGEPSKANPRRGCPGVATPGPTTKPTDFERCQLVSFSVPSGARAGLPSAEVVLERRLATAGAVGGHLDVVDEHAEARSTRGPGRRVIDTSTCLPLYGAQVDRSSPGSRPSCRSRRSTRRCVPVPCSPPPSAPRRCWSGSGQERVLRASQQIGRHALGRPRHSCCLLPSGSVVESSWPTVWASTNT